MALFVYICFFIGLVEVIKLPFRAYKFVKQLKNGERSFHYGRFRNDDRLRDDRSSGGRDSRGSNQYAGNPYGDYKDRIIDIDGNDDNDNRRMPDICET